MRASRWATLTATVTVCALAVVTLHFASRQLGAGDIFWMLRAGESALSTRTIADREQWSFTVAGTAWNNHEWLFEVLAALAHRAGGFAALRLATVVLFGLALGRLTLAAWQRLGPGWAALATASGLCFASFKLIPAPQTASLTFFVFASFAFLRRDQALTPRRTAALAATLLVWANLTAEALSFAPWIALDRGLWLVSRRHDKDFGTVARGEISRVALAFTALLATPRASSTLEYALTGSRVNRAVNTEFARLWEPATTVPEFLKTTAGIVIFVWILFAVLRLKRVPTVNTARALSAGALGAVMALAFERNLWMVLFAGADLAVALRDALKENQRWFTLGDLGATAAALALFVGFGTAIGWTPSVTLRALTSREYYSTQVDGRVLPVECVRPPTPFAPGTRLFTSRLWASYVLFQWPEVKIFIDGRNREYPEVLHRAAAEVFSAGPRAPAILDASGTQIVLAWPGWNTTSFVARSHWHPVRGLHTGRNCAVYSR